MAQLDGKDGALDRIHAKIETFGDVQVFPLLTPVAQRAHTLGEVGAIRDDGAALAAGAEILSRVEAETTEIAERAGAPATALGAVGLRRILDHGDAVTLGYFANLFDLSEPPVQMHRHDGLRPRRDRGLETAWVHRPRRRIDVDQNGRRADVEDRRDGCDEGHGHGDDLVARPHARGEQRQLERRRSGIERDTV
jgi:hypothetical protein